MHLTSSPSHTDKIGQHGSIERDGIIKLSSESENKKTVIVLNDNTNGLRKKREQEEVLILNEAVAKHAMDIRANECDGCPQHKSRDTMDKVERRV